MTRVVSPQVVVEGPYNTEKNLNNFKHELVTSDSFDKSAESDPKQQSIFGQSDNKNKLAPVSGSRSARVEGETSFSSMNRLYDSLSLKDSLRQYLRRLEALVIPTQGLGWKVTDKVRNKTYDPTVNRGFLISSMSWEHSASDPNRIKWDFDLQAADGLQDGILPQEYVNSRGYSDVGNDRVDVAGTTIEFQEVDTRRVTRDIEINSNDLIHQQEDSSGDAPVLGTIESGMSTEVTFGGTAYVPDNFETTIDNFDNQLHGEEAVLYDELSGVAWTGAITDSSSTINAGEPATRFDFNVDLIVGEVLTQ